jgi:hypothetical protein
MSRMRDIILDQIKSEEETEAKDLFGDDNGSVGETTSGTEDSTPDKGNTEDSTTRESADGEEAEPVERSAKDETLDPGKTTAERVSSAVEEAVDLAGYKGKFKVGDVVLSPKEVVDGLMRQADYTRSRQYYKPREELVDRLISDPAELARYARSQGMSQDAILKALGVDMNVKAKEEVAEPPMEFTTDTEKKLYEMVMALKGELNETRGNLSPKIEQFEKVMRTFDTAREQREFFDGFDVLSKQYNVPQSARHVIRSLLEEGKRVFKPQNIEYKLEHAFADYNKGVMPQNMSVDSIKEFFEKNPAEFEKMKVEWQETDKRKIAETRKRTLTPSSMTGEEPVERITSRKDKQPRNIREGIAMFKAAQGITD